MVRLLSESCAGEQELRSSGPEAGQRRVKGNVVDPHVGVRGGRQNGHRAQTRAEKGTLESRHSPSVAAISSSE